MIMTETFWFFWQDASDQKIEMEELKKSAAEENKALEKRKKAIDQEMAAVEPLVQEARRAVGSIKPESISEIRALRAPPDIIRDILEGVLRLMGIFDTSWVSMKRWEWYERCRKLNVGVRLWFKILYDPCWASDMLMDTFYGCV